VLKVSTEEKQLFKEKPAMFRDKPLTFIILVGLSFITFGLTFVILIYWWLKCFTTQLIVTTKIITLRSGIVSKNTTEIKHSDVRNLQVKQSMEQRIFGVGKISISSAGQSDMEIVISGIRKPQQVVKQLRELQS
jgi:uncharacterized membrane protein YdbT with pleckstrin-like domain